jgi:hypothetical protein
MRLWQIVRAVPDRAGAAIRGRAFELPLDIIRRDVGFADDPLQEAVVASAMGEASDSSRLAHSIFRVPNAPRYARRRSRCSRPHP